jgi:hypothetical protein
VTCKFVRRPYLAEYHIAAWNICGDPENKNLAVEFDSNVKPDGNRPITGSPWRNEHGILLTSVFGGRSITSQLGRRGSEGVFQIESRVHMT